MTKQSRTCKPHSSNRRKGSLIPGQHVGRLDNTARALCGSSRRILLCKIEINVAENIKASSIPFPGLTQRFWTDFSGVADSARLKFSAPRTSLSQLCNSAGSHRRYNRPSVFNLSSTSLTTFASGLPMLFHESFLSFSHPL